MLLINLCGFSKTPTDDNVIITVSEKCWVSWVHLPTVTMFGTSCVNAIYIYIYIYIYVYIYICVCVCVG